MATNEELLARIEQLEQNYKDLQYIVATDSQNLLALQKTVRQYGAHFVDDKEGFIPRSLTLKVNQHDYDLRQLPLKLEKVDTRLDNLEAGSSNAPFEYKTLTIAVKK